MEVHNHPHHGSHKRNWKSYLLEFFMLFLAVFLGFIAENIREDAVKRHKEKEYIESLVDDLRADTAKLSYGIALNATQSKGYDSLLTYWYAKPYSDSAIRNIYYLYRRYTGWFWKVLFTHRTIDQLRNAGGMVLLRNKIASDSIVTYYESADVADRTIDRFASIYQHEAYQTSYRIFDWSMLRDIPIYDSAYKILHYNKKFSFLKADINDQNTYIAELEVSGNILKNYLNMLLKRQQGCASLISVLQKQYHLAE